MAWVSATAASDDGHSVPIRRSAHQDEEHRHEKQRDGIDELVQRMLFALDEVAVVQILENQSGAKGADDEREPERCGSQDRKKQNESPVASSTPLASS